MRSLALVNYDGKVFWPPPTKFRSTCQVDVAYFPFDDQQCHLKLGSWLHDGFSVSAIILYITYLDRKQFIKMYSLTIAFHYNLVITKFTLFNSITFENGIPL